MDEYLRHNIYIIIEGGIKMALTLKQKAFIEEYVRNGYNGTKAYRTITPDIDPNKATKIASRIIKSPEGQEYMQQVQHDNLERFGNLPEMIIKELTDDLTYRDEKGNRSKTWQKSADLLQKQLGLQSTKVDVKGNMEIKVDLDD